MDMVLLENKGWEAMGNPVRKPRPGWIAQRSKAAFTIQVNATTMRISKFTVIYLKSYGALWKDTRLSVTVLTRRGNVTRGGKERHEIQGFHDSNTSVNYEADFPIRTPAEIGDSVHVHVNVHSGSTFRINGLMFCDD
jgi:hypothetical protein